MPGSMFSDAHESDVELELIGESETPLQHSPIQFQPRRRLWCSKGALATLISATLLLAVVLGVSYIAPRARKASAVFAQQLGEIKVVPPRNECSKTKDNCMSTKCCQSTGYVCYEVHPGNAKCMKSCTPGVNGTCLSQENYAPAESPSVTLSKTNLFCFTFYMQDTGSTKKNYQLDLLRTSLFLGTSIFGCEAWRVYSDVNTWLSPGKENTIQVHDVDGDFHFAKRKFKGTWVNSGIFLQVWKAIQKEGIWSTKDWTVKVDPDTVFLPSRLRTKLVNQEVTQNGIYLENCKYVNYGFFGDIEVFSHQAVATYIANLDDCKVSLNWKGSEKDTNYQPWGEDLFAQRCMDLHGVDKVSAWDITTNGLCEAYRPESQKKNKKWKPDCAVTFTPALKPFSKPKDYFECLKATQR